MAHVGVQRLWDFERSTLLKLSGFHCTFLLFGKELDTRVAFISSHCITTPCLFKHSNQRHLFSKFRKNQIILLKTTRVSQPSSFTTAFFIYKHCASLARVINPSSVHIQVISRFYLENNFIIPLTSGGDK
jgi:hypothetical protein